MFNADFMGKINTFSKRFDFFLFFIAKMVYNQHILVLICSLIEIIMAKGFINFIMTMLIVLTRGG